MRKEQSIIVKDVPFLIGKKVVWRGMVKIDGQVHFITAGQRSFEEAERRVGGQNGQSSVVTPGNLPIGEELLKMYEEK